MPDPALYPLYRLRSGSRAVRMSSHPLANSCQVRGPVLGRFIGITPFNKVLLRIEPEQTLPAGQVYMVNRQDIREVGELP